MKSGKGYTVMGNYYEAREDELLGGAARHLLLVMQTACRTFGLTWEQLRTPFCFCPQRHVAALVAHQRTQATHAEISYFMGLQGGKKGWSRTQSKRARRKMAAGSDEYRDLYVQLMAAVDALEASGIRHQTTPIVVRSGLSSTGGVKMAPSQPGVFGGYVG